MYEPIWVKLRELPHPQARKLGVSITSPRPFHKRIIKAVTKEKDIDVGYKIMLAEQFKGKYAILRHKRENCILTFYLEFSLTESDL